MGRYPIRKPAYWEGKNIKNPAEEANYFLALKEENVGRCCTS